MSWTTTNYGYWEYWAPYDPPNGVYGEHVCIFDGENKLIYVNPEINFVSVKEDIYSDWKEWTQVRDNSKYPPAIRVTGGDPIGGGLYTGDVYFLINGWRIFVDHSMTIDGVIYSDDFPSPYIQQAGTQIVTNVVSSLVQTTSPQVTVSEIPAIDDINAKIISINAYLDTVLTAVQTLPTETEIKNSVWNAQIADHTTAGTFGHYIQKKILSVAKFIGLK